MKETPLESTSPQDKPEDAASITDPMKVVIPKGASLGEAIKIIRETKTRQEEAKKLEE